jgi:hypothetical protein
MDLTKATEAQLKLELKRREEEKAKKDLPEVLPVIDAKNIIEFAKEVRDSINSTGFEPKDTEHFAYETIMETVFGHAYWDWHNKRVR